MNGIAQKIATRRRVLWFAASISIALLLFAYCNSDTRDSTPSDIVSPIHNTLPMDDVIKSLGPKIVEAARLPKPSIQLISHAKSEISGQSCRQVELVVINPTNEPMNYYGYRMDSWETPPPTGQIHPFFLAQKRDQLNGEWKKIRIGRCGTGSGLMMIPAKHAARFTADFECGAVPCRIVLHSLSKDPVGNSRGEELVSDEIAPAAE
jgi:hypothetical protein